MSFYYIARFTVFLLSKLFLLRVQVAGLENIPKQGGFILAGNHASNLDPLLLGVFCPRRLSYMAKQELFKGWFFSKILFNVGAFPVKKKSADLSAIKEAMKRVKSGEGLLLFPGGTRVSVDKDIEPLSGIGFLASKLAVPVVPAYISGTEKAMPIGARFIKPAKITVQFGRQIFVERDLPYQQISRQIMNEIEHLS